ncbi:hypothetical protein [Nocardioides ungokensis]
MMNAATSTPTQADDSVLRQLMNHAQLISQIRQDIDALAHEATDTVAGLIARLEDIESQSTTPGSAPTSWCWRSIGSNAADELWHLLTDWINWIRGRYPLARKIPPCWADHPELVEELTALWLAWQHAYEDRNAPLTAAADWHDRWLPGVLYRLEHGAFALDCANDHHPRPAAAYASPEPNGVAERTREGDSAHAD